MFSFLIFFICSQILNFILLISQTIVVFLTYFATSKYIPTTVSAGLQIKTISAQETIFIFVEKLSTAFLSFASFSVFKSLPIPTTLYCLCPFFFYFFKAIPSDPPIKPTPIIAIVFIKFLYPKLMLFSLNRL